MRIPYGSDHAFRLKPITNCGRNEATTRGRSLGFCSTRLLVGLQGLVTFSHEFPNSAINNSTSISKSRRLWWKTGAMRRGSWVRTYSW